MLYSNFVTAFVWYKFYCTYDMDKSVLAGIWGLVSGSALVIGALIGYYINVSQRVVAGIMSFGSGVLISALSFNLMDEAYKAGGFDSTAIGFIAGSVVYTIANIYISKKGAKHRKRSGSQQHSEDSTKGSGMAIAVGSLLDGIPESIVIGISLISNAKVSFVAVIAIFLSNIPEGLSSSAGMKKAGRTSKYVFLVWTSIALICGLASFCGFAVFSHFSPEIIAATTAVAAGAILTMLADTMIPEAYEFAHQYTGVITVIGFLTAYIINKQSF
ncbi:MAG: family zinc transporter [Bacteroidetes bacterium]|nr:family zinc transporter [Bacteroidota bacterium]